MVDSLAVESVVFPSELGWMAAAWRGRRLARFVFGHATAKQAAAAIADHAAKDFGTAEDHSQFVDTLQAFARGDAVDLSWIELDTDHMTAFQKQVTEQCRRIPAGKTMTYGELAACAKSPKAARAVGNVMAGNRFPLIVPCHRVVGCQGALGGFSAPDGISMKQRLLRLERTS